MKELNQYIQEKLIVNNNISNYLYHPKDRDGLIECIKEKIDKEELGNKDKILDLNDINTSDIIDMSYLFDARYGPLKKLSNNGYFDISEWDVSNVENMGYMFWKSNFNRDISNWNLSNVKNMFNMFAWSNFNGNISNWNVSKNVNMYSMFAHCPLEKNPPKWYKR